MRSRSRRGPTTGPGAATPGAAEDFARLGDLLGEVCPAPAPGPCESGAGPRHPAPQDAARLLAGVWPEVVGAEVAANARPVQLRQGRLVVSASSSAWAQTLQLMSDAILCRLNERLGYGTVERVVFRHAGWEERSEGLPSAVPTAAPSRPARLTAEERDALARVRELDLAPELREKITRAMKAAFVRGEQDFVR